jgi:hypothetical protein
MKRPVPFRPHSQMHSSVLYPRSPAYPPSRVQLARSLGTWFAVYSLDFSSQRLGAFALSAHPGVHGFPVFRLLCPIRLCLRASAFRWGLPCLLPTRLHIPHAVSRVPCRRLKRNGLGGVLLAAPSALCSSPVHLQGKTGLPVVPLHDIPLLWPLFWRRSGHFGRDWLASQTRYARGSFSRRARHASRDSPCHSSAKPPPLGGLPPPHGAFQEHAAHLVEWSTTLSSKGSLGACTPKVLPHSSTPLSRRTATKERTLFPVGSRPMLGHGGGLARLDRIPPIPPLRRF